MIFNKVETMSISEFINREEVNKLDKMIAHLKKNKEKYILVVIIIALTVDLSCINVFANSGTAMFNKFYDVAKTIVKIISLVGFVTESGKAVLTGTVDSIGKIAMKYIAFILSINFAPTVIDWLFSI